LEIHLVPQSKVGTEYTVMKFLAERYVFGNVQYGMNIVINE